ncbi:hypothetical protein Smp_176070 [Schistosoma mansoni]|uniref:hypothetical protein n=1 Tax=Schistosoma mansoni TaxID=6183 RepID=UPI00022C8132|nr:hypothetical protein Smp_176070 [Schistosoma mansoni]|eukprot:XP_018645196.1 hypothetical protein Smp_176070 [Schistosoma mansoni]
MSSNPNQKSSKLSKSGFKGLSRSKKHKKGRKDKEEVEQEEKDKVNQLNILNTSPKTLTTYQDTLNDQSMEKNSCSLNEINSMDLQQTTNGINDPIVTNSITGVTISSTTNENTFSTILNHNNNNNKSKQKIKKKEEKKLKYTTTTTNTTDSMITVSQSNLQHSNSIKTKKKRGLKLHSHNKSTKKEQTKTVNKTIFGMPLDVACSRNPSHDGIVLPAFFRHCIDYIEQYGLSSEGIYRVPGVHSQVQAVISAIDNGIEFPDIPPTSAAFYCNQANYTKQRSSHFQIGSDSSSKGKIRHLSSSHSKSKEYNSQFSHKSSDNRGRNIPTPTNFITGAFCVKNSNSGLFNNSPIKQSSSILTTTNHSSISSQTTGITILPHDPAVIASVIKHFLRSLPEPILTKRLSNVIESFTTDNIQFYHNLSVLIHQELPISNRYLLAWIIQHMMHIIDRAGENRMTLANIIIVLSPCLGISHRLLGILLNPIPPKDFSLDLCKLDPKLPPFTTNNIDPSNWHWLFPHPIYLLKSYIPPLKSLYGLELPDTNEELDIELKKQESLLAYLCEQIQMDSDEGNSSKEYHLRNVQHIMTELKRRKSLTDPEAIRQEIIKQQAHLDRLHNLIIQSTSSGSKDNCNQRRRITGTDKHSKGHRQHSTTFEKIPYSDELWEVQREITTLKRKLKQHERSKALQQSQQSSDMTTATSTSSSFAGTNELKSNNPCILFMSGAPLVIPSVLELDQEEVLNLTLRKLPIEPISSMTQQLPTTRDGCSEKSINDHINHGNIELNEQISTATPLETMTTGNGTVVTNDCIHQEDNHHIDNDVNNDEDGGGGANDNSCNTLNVNNIIQDENNNHEEGYLKENTDNENKDNHINDKSMYQQEVLTSNSQQQMSNMDNQVVKQEIKPEDILHSPSDQTPIEINDKTIPNVYTQNTLIPTNTNDNNIVLYPNETTSTVDNSTYSISHSPSLPPPSDLAPKLSEFIKTSSTVDINDPKSRQIMYYKARKQELIAIQTDLHARIRSENAEISRLQSCINHLLESGGRRAKRIYRTYMTAKRFCPAWLLNQNPIISTPRHTLNNEDQMNYYISQPWTKIAESLTTVINDNVLDDDDDDHTTATTQYSSINNQKETCLLDEYSSDSDRHHRHLHFDNDDNGDGDSLVEPILTNRGSSPDSVAYSRLTEEENDINSVRNVQLTKREQNNDDDDDDDDDDEEEEEEYDDEDECELELATTLHQLTLDNARLEQLNARSLEAIQAERNRCADLKVLLKLRHNSYNKPIGTI